MFCILNCRSVHANTQVQEISDDVDINNLGPQLRSTLTRRSFLSNIERQTDAVLVLRGSFCPPGVKPPAGQRPLHIHISSGPLVGQVLFLSAPDSA